MFNRVYELRNLLGVLANIRRTCATARTVRITAGARDMGDATRARPRAPSGVAPHVHAAIGRLCAGDGTAIAEVLAALDADQRRGWRPLPDPLPAVPALIVRAGDALPADAEPDHLLALALCETGTVHTLSAILGCGLDGLADSPLAQLLELRGGRFRFADPAVRARAIVASTAPQRQRAHQRLAAVATETGEEDMALWHGARGAVSADPGYVEPLISLSCAALRDGDVERAWTRVAEAAEHVPRGSSPHARALLCGARAALAGGWVADALERAEQALRIDGEHRGDATAVFVLAHTLCHGVVPAPDALIPDDASGRGYRLAAALGASLAAERGDRERGAAWLSAGSRIDRGAGEVSPSPRCDVPTEEASVSMTEGADLLGRVAHALYVGLDGDPDAGVRALAAPEQDGRADPLGGVLIPGPLLYARRAVAEVLLYVWAGRIGTAHALLAASAAELPVALPFAGLAVALSRRLDLAVDGGIGRLSQDLATSVPWIQESDGFVDRAISAYLKGHSDEAAVHMGLWADRGRPSESLGLPGLDEIGPLGSSTMSVAAEPSEAAAGRSLRERVRSARETSWCADLDAVAEESRSIRSPFERARVEALLGSSCAARGDRARGIRHLRAARSLFEESGARAWRGMVDRRLRMMAERRPRTPEASGEGEGETGASSLKVCRAMWVPILTTRELDVALRMAEGRSNRDIAAALHVSVRTVEVHGGRIFAKLDVRTRHELTVLAHRTEQHL